MSLSIFEDLAEKSWTVQNDWLSPEETRHLASQIRDLRQSGAFRAAGFGRTAAADKKIRGDEILWLSPDQAIAQHFWPRLEDLRQQLNREFFLGLTGFEAHLAAYPVGSFYAAHHDRPPQSLPGHSQRMISLVLYLNPEWHEDDGGELAIYDPHHPETPEHRILPLGGRLVLFRSDTILHGVLPAKRERLSLTAWFRKP